MLRRKYAMEGEMGCGHRGVDQVMALNEGNLARWPRKPYVDSLRSSFKFAIWKCTAKWISFCVVISVLVAPAMAASYPNVAHTMGINYGRLGNNLPNSSQTVNLIKNLGVGMVRIFDSDGPTITAFAGSGLELVIGMGNDVISSLAASANTADQWIATNVVPYYPATNITYITVGNELFSDESLSSTWTQLVTAIENLDSSLQSRGLSAISVSTAVEYSILSNSYPPSKGVFRSDIGSSVITPLLQHLDSTNSYLFVNVYPYFGWRDDSADIPLDFALFTRKSVFYTDGQYQYSNLLDAQLDAMAAAMESVGYGEVRIVMSETGWPTLGDSGNSGLGANISNAETYNNNLANYILSAKGTPRRPDVFVPTFIFALYNENEKTGDTIERNWGVLYPSGDPVYPLDLTSGSSSSTTSGGGGGGGSSGGGSSPSQPKTCNGRPSVLSLSASFFGILFNLRI